MPSANFYFETSKEKSTNHVHPAIPICRWNGHFKVQIKRFRNSHLFYSFWSENKKFSVEAKASTGFIQDSLKTIGIIKDGWAIYRRFVAIYSVQHWYSYCSHNSSSNTIRSMLFVHVFNEHRQVASFQTALTWFMDIITLSSSHSVKKKKKWNSEMR